MEVRALFGRIVPRGDITNNHNGSIKSSTPFWGGAIVRLSCSASVASVLVATAQKKQWRAFQIARQKDMLAMAQQPFGDPSYFVFLQEDVISIDIDYIRTEE